MRGALRRRRLVVRCAGIIPAYAGSTAGCRRAAGCRWDHPRVCGEHWNLLSPATLFGGSSPRMRGALVAVLVAGPAAGIIPAYAGSTTALASRFACRWDHPRVCGEHILLHRLQSLFLGSSPRMRGAPRRARIRESHSGIIPAYAGSTFRQVRRSGRRGDHPRVCGEHRRTPQKPDWSAGSSPRMRGAQRHLRYEVEVVGIIPAYAGSTDRRTCDIPKGRDHPRVCGEHPFS